MCPIECSEDAQFRGPHGQDPGRLGARGSGSSDLDLDQAIVLIFLRTNGLVLVGFLSNSLSKLETERPLTKTGFGVQHHSCRALPEVLVKCCQVVAGTTSHVSLLDLFAINK